MEHIYSKVKPDKILHSVYRIKDIDDVKTKRCEITAEKEFLQCVIMRLEKNKRYIPHKHVKKAQSTFEFQVQEAFIVLFGQVLIEIFDIDNSFLCKVILNAGDLAILLEGGHSITSQSTNTVIYEIKTGPYEGQLLDKKFIEE